MNDPPRPADVMAVADAIDAGLRAVGDPERGGRDLTYLKAPAGIASYGIGVPEMRSQVKAYLRENGEAEIGDLVAVAENLWARPVHSTRAFAVEMLEQRKTNLGVEHMELVERRFLQKEIQAP
ncbi:MAG: DNA alkylation repair protein [Chloroflexi bacterium]|nr:DNA alkylation repair protein [Chloroflexota bacterium]